jgi:hypothetical protein
MAPRLDAALRKPLACAALRASVDGEHREARASLGRKLFIPARAAEPRGFSEALRIKQTRDFVRHVAKFGTTPAGEEHRQGTQHHAHTRVRWRARIRPASAAHCAALSASLANGRMMALSFSM